MVKSVDQTESKQLTTDVAAKNEPQNGQSASLDSLVLLCCKDVLRLYPLKSVVQGNEQTLYKVKLAKPCCWTSTFTKDEKTCGLILLYQSGNLEIRSLPDLEVVKVTSLMSILRWSFKANMEKTMSCTENGQISMINGSEVPFVSLLNGGDDFRVLESLPSLHDKVLASAIDAVISSSQNQRKKQGAPGALVNILKGFKGGKAKNGINFPVDFLSSFSNLDKIFSKNPFPDEIEYRYPSPRATHVVPTSLILNYIIVFHDT